MSDKTIRFLGVLGVVTALTIAITCGVVAVRNHEIDQAINQQTEVQKTEIIQAEKTKRAETHLEWLPWN